MKKTKAVAFLGFGVLWYVLDRELGHGHWFGWLGIPVAIYGLMRLLSRLESEQNLRAIKDQFAKLDCMAAGLHFLGSESEMIDWRRTDNPRDSGPVQGVQLCRTRKGQWFQFRVDVHHGRAHLYSVDALNEAGARSWFKYDVDAYKKFFGEPELA
jgi:hypothetical protein